MWGPVCVLLLLLAGAAGQVDDECVATAIAATAPGEAAGDAVSNAFAETFTESIVCEDGSGPNIDSVGGLSVAVALAVSEANEIGQTCAADAEAAAEFATDFVAEELESGLVGAAGEGDNVTLANAWFESERGKVMDSVASAPDFLGDDGCLDLAALANGLPSAISLGNLLGSAVNQILTAVQCGTNVVPTDEPCRWENRTYIGRCITSDPKPAPVDSQSAAPPSPSPEARSTAVPKPAPSSPAPKAPTATAVPEAPAATPKSPSSTVTITTTPAPYDR